MPGLWGQPAAWGHSDCRVPATTPAPAQEAWPSACDREGARARRSSHTGPGAPSPHQPERAQVPLWPRPAGRAQPVLGAHLRPQAGGSGSSGLARGRQVHTGSPQAQGLRGRPEGVLSRMMGRAGPPTRPAARRPWHLTSGLGPGCSHHSEGRGDRARRQGASEPEPC